jgi:hypothetical protein
LFADVEARYDISRFNGMKEMAVAVEVVVEVQWLVDKVW